MSVVVITGTDTGVGKTIATATLACHARLAGLDVAVCKPVQTGTADGDDDLAEVARLSGVTALAPGWRYPEPLAPVAAAHRAQMALPTRAEMLGLVTDTDRPGRLTLVEGAGGLLVELGADGVTLRDLTGALQASVLLVVGPGLGTLNHTVLNLEALAAQAIPCVGLIIGSWPNEPGVAEVDNRGALGRLTPVRAALPEGTGRLSAVDFESMSASAFDPAWVAGLVG